MYDILNILNKTVNDLDKLKENGEPIGKLKRDIERVHTDYKTTMLTVARDYKAELYNYINRIGKTLLKSRREKTRRWKNDRN